MLKPRKFTVTDSGAETVYNGFDRDFEPVELDHVVLVLVDGGLDVFAVTQPAKMSDLLRYLNDRGEDAKILGVYSRKGSI
jgi:hypothetical protein